MDRWVWVARARVQALVTVQVHGTYSSHSQKAPTNKFPCHLPNSCEIWILSYFLSTSHTTFSVISNILLSPTCYRIILSFSSIGSKIQETLPEFDLQWDMELSNSLILYSFSISLSTPIPLFLFFPSRTTTSFYIYISLSDGKYPYMVSIAISY